MTVLKLAHAEMLECLFDTAQRDHVVELIKGAHDPVPKHYREGLASSLEGILLPYLSQFQETLYADGRGESAAEFDATWRFKNAVEQAARILRLAEGSSMDASVALELATEFDDAWTRFIADSSAHRMYDDRVKELRRFAKARRSANQIREDDADRMILKKFSAWQRAQRASSLRERGQPMLLAAIVKRYLQVARPRPTDREKRRLTRLMREGRVASHRK